MKLSLNIKPTKVIGNTKSALLSNVSNQKITHGLITENGKSFSYTGFQSPSDESKITVVNLHKVRKKSLQDKRTDGKTKSKVVVKPHWIAYVYTFDIEMLKQMGYKSINQNTRNFELKK